MSLSRSKRTAKPIKYFVPENDSSDDNDFCDFTPPSKKIKETNNKKKSKRDQESRDTIVSNDSPKDKSPKQRLSLEERKFQRELEMALELSATNKEPFPGFNKKKDDKENELEFFSPLRTTFAEVEVHPEPPSHDKDIPCSKDSELEIIDISSNEDNVDGACVNKNIKIEVEKLDNINQTTNGSETILPSRLQSNNNLGDVQNTKQKKERKKVNFIDDESDGFSENEIEESYKSETDESDYFPSPSKSKRKNEKKKKKNSKEKDSKPKKDIEKRKPLSVTQINTVIKSPKLSKDKDVNSRKKDISLSESSPKVFTPVAVSKVPAPEKSCSTTKPSSVVDDKSRGITKMSYQSPLLKSTSESPRTPARIGLRLGLSRKAPLKPLHPNASVK